jgi:uncharacterized protein HemY
MRAHFGMVGIMLAALTASAFAAQTKAPAAGKASAKAALSQAESAARQAATMNDQWTPTAAALKAARAAFKTGDYAKAQRLAAQAAKFAGLSVEQARQQKKLWRSEVVR